MCKIKVDFEKLSAEIMGMNDSQVGRYVRLLCAQAALGTVQPETFKAICGSDALVGEKFQVQNGGYVARNIEVAAAQQPKVDTKKPDKIKYAEYVMMKPDDYGKLVAQYGKEAVEKMVAILDNYKGSSGKRYKDDHRAILTWVVTEAKKRFPTLFQREKHFECERDYNRDFFADLEARDKKG